MSEVDTSAVRWRWPREIWAEERGEFMHEGVHVYHPAATVPRWEDDRPGPYHKYIDVDIYDSSEKHHAARYHVLAAERNALRAQLAAAQTQLQTARDDALREAIALCDWDTSDSELFALENKLRALIQTTEPRPDAAKEE